jgi:rhodanese-related sulfurtransferase
MEWDQGHIDGARLWPLSKIMAGHLPDVPQNAEIILHCQKGMRSFQAAQILKAQGYQEVYSMSGGYETWLQEL